MRIPPADPADPADQGGDGTPAQDAGIRYGYRLDSLRAVQRRFTVASYVVMGVVTLGLGVWLAFVSTGDWWSDFALPFLIAVGAGLLAFVAGMVAAQVLRQLVPDRARLFTDTVALGVMAVFGLFVVSLFADSEAALVGALLGVVVATAAPLTVATSPISTILRDAPHAEALVQELHTMPSWSHPLSGEIRGLLIGVTADLVYRCAALILLWLSAGWLFPLIVLTIAEAFFSARGVARRNRVLWLAPSILAAIITVTMAAVTASL